jgi:peptidoglycan/LPS O-acetylase OafA/YrhL
VGVVDRGQSRVARLLDTDGWRPLGHVPSLDGIRGIAVLMVMLVHFTRDRYLLGLLISLDSFFVMSGFLITTLLLDEWYARGRVDMRAFYIRRAFRLLPALYAMLTLLVVGGLVGLWGLKRAVFEAFCAAFYIYPAVLTQEGIERALLVPLWSLSVEEWFYFSLPPLLVLGVLRRRSPRNLKVLLGAFMVAYLTGVVMKMTVSSASGGVRGILQMRPEVLMLGSAAAFFRQYLLRQGTERMHTVVKWVARLGVASFVLTSLFGTAFPDYRYQGAEPDLVGRPVSELVDALPAPSWFGQFFGVLGGPGYLFGIVGVAGLILYTTTTTPENRIARFLENRVLRLAGVYSYAIYLYHYPLANQIVPKLLPDSIEYDRYHVVWSHLVLHIVLSSVLTFIAAYLSMRLVERPAQALRRRRFASATLSPA